MAGAWSESGGGKDGAWGDGCDGERVCWCRLEE